MLEDKLKNSPDHQNTINIGLSQEEFALLRAKIREVLAAAALAQERMAEDQKAIEQLKMETREILARLRAA